MGLAIAVLGVLDARSTYDTVWKARARRPRALAPRQQRRDKWAEAWAGGPRLAAAAE